MCRKVMLSWSDTRRIGGLENKAEEKPGVMRDTRRIGGLEIMRFKRPETVRDTRRIGGLEIGQ